MSKFILLVAPDANSQGCPKLMLMGSQQGFLRPALMEATINPLDKTSINRSITV